MEEEIKIVRISAFFFGLSFSVLHPGLWLYLKDSHASITFFAITLSAYAGGSGISGLLFGYLLNYYRPVMMISSAIMAAASGWYIFADNAVEILVIRIIQGLICGQGALLLAASVSEDRTFRTKALAKLNSSITLGYVCGPLIATVIAYIESFSILGHKIHSVALSGLVSMICQILIMFISSKYKPVEKLDLLLQLRERDERDYLLSNSDFISRRHSNFRLIFLALGFAVENLVFSAYDSLAVPIAHQIFSWNRVEVCLSWTVVSLICYLCYLICSSVSRKISDDIILHGALIVESAGIFLLAYVEFQAWRFIVAGTLMLIGYSFGNLLFETMYSKELTSSEVGKFMGILYFAGSLPRIAGPFFFSYVYQLGRYNFVFTVIGCLIVFLLIVSILFEVTLRRQLAKNSLR